MNNLFVLGFCAIAFVASDIRCPHVSVPKSRAARSTERYSEQDGSQNQSAVSGTPEPTKITTAKSAVSSIPAPTKITTADGVEIDLSKDNVYRAFIYATRNKTAIAVKEGFKFEFDNNGSLTLSLVGESDGLKYSIISIDANTYGRTSEGDLVLAVSYRANGFTIPEEASLLSKWLQSPFNSREIVKLYISLSENDYTALLSGKLDSAPFVAYVSCLPSRDYWAKIDEWSRDFKSKTARTDFPRMTTSDLLVEGSWNVAGDYGNYFTPPDPLLHVAKFN